jgi:hypothetical protein
MTAGGFVVIAWLIAAVSSSGWWSQVTRAIRLLATTAGAFDCVENFALLRVLARDRLSHWPRIARRCAVAKFALVNAGLVFAVGGFIAALPS